MSGASRWSALRRRVAARRARPGVEERLAALEAEVQENRRLHRRIAELTDVVTELLVPLAERDESRVEELLAAYRLETGRAVRPRDGAGRS